MLTSFSHGKEKKNKVGVSVYETVHQLLFFS